MSIGSILSSALSNPWASSISSQSETTASWSSATGTRGGVQSGSTTASPTNPFQNLASDIQAMLIQAQTGAAGSTAASPSSATGAPTATGSTTAVTPEQQFATDLQTMMNDLQGTQSSTSQTASATAADPATGQTEHHHHHHHHEDGGGEASGFTAIAESSTSSSTTTTGASASNAAVSQIFASDITQALQAYGSGPGSTVTPGMIM